MTRAELKAAAKEQLKGNVWKFFLVNLIVFLISFGCGLIPVVGSIASALIAPALSVGATLIYLAVSYGNPLEIATMFDGFKYFGKALFLSILVGVFTFLWSLLFVIPGIIKTYSYSMAFYILAENPEMTAREALNESKAIMDGHKMELFIQQLSFIPWILLTGITFGLAGIYVIPYIQLTMTNFYNDIKDIQPEAVATEAE